MSAVPLHCLLSLREEGSSSCCCYSVEVLFVRHAESRNNALRREVMRELGPDGLQRDPSALHRELDKRRSQDAGLSARGEKQAQVGGPSSSCQSSAGRASQPASQVGI